MPLNSPGSSAAGANVAAAAAAGYQSSLPSCFPSSDFHLTSADINMLRNLETAGILSSWSAGQNGLTINNNNNNNSQ